MVRLLAIFIVVIMCVGCDAENAPDCFQAAGETIRKEFVVPEYSKISVLQRTQLIVKQGIAQSVVVETGENLLDDIDVYVQDGTLIIDNKNACNLVREYGLTKVYVTQQELSEIRNASGLPVRSDGVLSYATLQLTSEDLETEDAFHKTGDFYLELKCDSLSIVTNGKSNFFLLGAVNALDLKFMEGDSRFEGKDLSVNTATIFHRGTNDIYLNPRNAVTGELRSTGNLILFNTPPVLDVKALYKGKVIKL
ncbi:head GIN domain-containing protein [Aquimarina intermedia]|uniref:Putative autotransporter adhesin-like protein n=1 Tax=Aquimarina intermedia TaxID=350814 RepID=A0A5S5CD04_9FLAO|nr:head GIN domain-containing protein [Aquimarina intermedia]TYP77255.1 putative autotransporter adhesin-like protein [Aquimarina intermedia]